MTKTHDLRAVEIARRIRRLNQTVHDLTEELRESHPNGDAMAEALYEQCVSLASAEVVIHEHLEHPENYRIEFGIALTGVRTKKET
jgi:hypothetical protein